jgi:hypothetical protein
MLQSDVIFLVIKNIFSLFPNGTHITEEQGRAMDCSLIAGQLVQNFIQKI